MTENSYTPLPAQGGSARQVARAVNLLLEGRMNSTAEVDAANGTSSLVVSDPRVGPGRLVFLMASSPAARDATVSIANKEFTITFASALSADEVISYLVVG